MAKIVCVDRSYNSTFCLLFVISCHLFPFRIMFCVPAFQLTLLLLIPHVLNLFHFTHFFNWSPYHSAWLFFNHVPCSMLARWHILGIRCGSSSYMGMQFMYSQHFSPKCACALLSCPEGMMYIKLAWPMSNHGISVHSYFCIV